MDWPLAPAQAAALAGLDQLADGAASLTRLKDLDSSSDSVSDITQSGLDLPCRMSGQHLNYGKGQLVWHNMVITAVDGNALYGTIWYYMAMIR